MFRGKRRFVIGVCSGGLRLERVYRGRHKAGYAFYSVGSAEKAVLRVIKKATPHARARARRLLEESCMPWTRIVWAGDQPTYVHDVAHIRELP